MAAVCNSDRQTFSPPTNFATESKSVMYIVFHSVQSTVGRWCGSGIVATFFLIG